MEVPTGIHYYHYDNLGSVANLTSANGTTEWTYDWEPFGTPRLRRSNGSPPANYMWFAGERMDPNTALYNLRARQYYAYDGRFLTTDPVDSTQSPYIYANDQPTVLTDPTGTRPVIEDDPGQPGRRPLRIAGEYEYGVAPLLEADAIDLFCRRALITEPPDVITQICRRLDGLPLAIELAAAHTKVLTPDDLLLRLERRLPLLVGGRRDAPERQQTLRAALEWSYELLAAEEKALFARLSVFSGGFTVAAVEDVCLGSIQTLEALVDNSLVLRQTNGRLAMLETIREFARERLQETEEAAELRLRHADYFREKAEEVKRGWRGPRGGMLLGEFRLENDNMLAALDWLVEDERGETALRLGAALGGWATPVAAVREPLERILQWDQNIAPAVRADALLELGMISAAEGDITSGDSFVKRALVTYGELEDQRGAALCLIAMGSNAARRGDAARATALLERSRLLAHELGDPTLEGYAWNRLGQSSASRGDLQLASSHYEEAIRCWRQVGNVTGVAAALLNLAWLSIMKGDQGQAEAQASESLHLRARFDHPRFRADGLDLLGWVTIMRGDLVSAAEHLRESLLISAAGVALNKETSIECIEGLAFILASRGDPLLAVRLLSATESLRGRCELSDGSSTERYVQAVVAALGKNLDPSEFKAAWSDGTELSFREATDLALCAGHFHEDESANPDASSL
jgi:RHS repeat-associated protein